MKSKIIALAVLTAVVLSGCSESGGNSGSSSDKINSISSSSTESTVQSTQSSYSGAPTVIAPNFVSSSVSEKSTPNEEQSTSSEVQSVISETTSSESSVVTSVESPVGAEDVPDCEMRTINSGENMTVDGSLSIGKSARLRVEGTLYVSGTITINEDGALELIDGGKLIMTSENALIDGVGRVNVGENFDQINCEVGTIKTRITPPERVVKDGVTTVGGIVIANKAISLPPEYGSYLSLDEVTPETYAALEEMNSNSEHQYINKSGYRSYYDQKAIFQNYCDMYGYDEADTFSSQAGHSEHQTGLTMDLDAFEESYGETPEGIWLAENCWRYGFIIRYPKGKEEITGYTYEPWHVRYLGKSTAKLVYDSGLTLEEFLNVEGGTTVID